MKIDEEKLLTKLDNLWKDKQCPICRNSNWGIDNKIVTPVNVDENKNIELGGKFSPLIPITCDNCGYTIFINALKLGVLELDEGDKNG